MGTDNLFHKRKAKSAADLKRREVKRDAYTKVLIVCEGEKSEPNYFNGLRDHYSLNSANVEICGHCGSDPLSIVTYAKQRYRDEKDAGDAFDKVYCVFDRDSHADYTRAIGAIRGLTPKNTYFAITSVPCFEYWVLLHFIFTTKPYSALPGSSAASQVLKELKDYMPDYTKADKAIFAVLVAQLDFAKANATRSLKCAEANGTDNPSTHVHELVDFLQRIKSGRARTAGKC